MIVNTSDWLEMLLVLAGLGLAWIFIYSSFHRKTWRADRKRYVTIKMKGFSFKDKLEEAKMQPNKIIMYGQNTFACDDNVRKILIKSVKLHSITLLDYGELVSYQLVKDGTVLSGKPFGGSGGSSGYDTVPDESGVLCSDLSLTIETKNPSCQNAELPFIYFPEKSGNAYRQALEAAWEAAKSLDKIL